MLRRIFWIALLTGSGQLFAVFALKRVSRVGSSGQVQGIGQTDTLIFLIINVLAMGLQSAAMRDLATSADWRADYRSNQTARMTLGLLLMPLAALSFVNPFYGLFLLAPLLALNGDYALYARGRAIAGATVAFLRLLLPGVAILAAAALSPAAILAAYIGATILAYLGTNLYIAALLGAPPVVPPAWRSLHSYLRSLALGVVILALYVIGIGLMMVLPFFYSTVTVAVAFVGLKFYVLFKGVLRIIHQAFVKEMTDDAVCLKVDQLSSLIGLSFAVFTIAFPDTVIRLFFGEKYLPDRDYFIWLSLAGCVYSLFASFIIRAMLEKKDRANAIVASGSAVLTIVLVMIASRMSPRAVSVGISVFIGEVIFAAGMLAIHTGRGLLWRRLLFLAQNLPIAAVPVAIAFFAGDRMPAFMAGVVAFAVPAALLHFRKFSFPANGEAALSLPVTGSKRPPNA